MVNASFVFGMDGDDESVFDRTVEWAIAQGIETATFHILTPYPDTALYTRMEAEERLSTATGTSMTPAMSSIARPRLSPEALEDGYWRAYSDFYRWGSIVRGAWTHEGWGERLRHAAYAGGWKKLEPMWDFIIRAKRASSMLPVLETVLAAFGSRRPTHQGATELEIPPTPLEPAPSVARADESANCPGIGGLFSAAQQRQHCREPSPASTPGCATVNYLTAKAVRFAATPQMGCCHRPIDCGPFVFC